VAVAAVIVMLLVCAGLVTAVVKASGADDSFSMDWGGTPATVTTYNQQGKLVDKVHGKSIRVTRDETFDSVNQDGTTNADSKVLLITVGQNAIRHVGSSLIIAQDGLVDLTPKMHEANLSIDNTEPGTPWLHKLYEQASPLWGGKAKTIVIRSQDGMPIAVFAGNKVITRKTDVPTSTWFEVDGMYLFVYRCDYTEPDTALLQQT